VGCGVMEAAESCFAFFLAEGERMRGGEEVGGGVDFRNSAGESETNGGCTAALETSTRV
jgi:hypothetical protein